VSFQDIYGGFAKSFVFAAIVATICCYQGYFTHMRQDSFGAKSVSLSTTSAVVLSCILVLVSDYVVTEAGFGFDLGAEKFFDIVCPYGGLCTSAVVLVATVRAIKHHGGIKVKDLNKPDLEAVKKGLVNLEKHLENIRKFGMKSVVAINKFPTDTDDELELVEEFANEKGFAASIVDYWGKGSVGGLRLAEQVVSMIEGQVCHLNKLYDWDDTVEKKIAKVAMEIYGAQKIDFQPQAKKDLRIIKKFGYDKLPICIAKTQKSLSDNPKLLGRPKNFLVTVREILLASGAGFLIPITGEIMRMPGLPKKPSALQIDIDNEGKINGLF